FVREHSPASFGMTRCDPYRVSAVEQTANNAMAEKARAAENQNPAKLSRHARLRRSRGFLLFSVYRRVPNRRQAPALVSWSSAPADQVRADDKSWPVVE